MRRIGPGFFAQNKRVVVLGALGVTLGVIGFVGLLFGGITTLFRNSAPYKTGVERAVNDVRVQAALGMPIEVRWWVTGQLRNQDVNYSVPLEGSTKKGTLRIVAHSEEFEKLRVEIEDAPTIDLLTQ